jgi:hypothetical protein
VELEHLIQLTLKRHGHTMQAPAALDRTVNQGLEQLHAPTKRLHLTIKRIGIAVLIASIALTVTAFSSPSMADRIYGSYDILKKKVVTLSIQQYQQVAFKFMGAQKELGTDFPAFEKLSKQLVAAKINDSDANQNIDFDGLPTERRTELKQLLADIHPYFDRLNHQPVARDVLNAEEYDAYIQAMMKRESIMAKGNVNPSAGPVETKDLPQEYRDEYEKSKQLIRALEDKVRQSVSSPTP